MGRTFERVQPPKWAADLLNDINAYVRETYGPHTVRMTWYRRQQGEFSSGFAHYASSHIHVRAGSNRKHATYILLHEAAHAVSTINRTAKGHRSSGQKDGSCDGHCTGFYETMFGEVVPKFKPKSMTWRYILGMEFSYKPRNAYKVARRMGISGAKKAYKERRTTAIRYREYWDEWAKNGNWATTKREIEYRVRKNLPNISAKDCYLQDWGGRLDHRYLKQQCDKFERPFVPDEDCHCPTCEEALTGLTHPN